MKYIIIGNGVAGITAAENIRKIDSAGEITIFSDEAVPYYSRIRLIEYLAKEAGAQDIIIHKDEWYKERKIDIRLNSPVSEIEAEQD